MAGRIRRMGERVALPPIHSAKQAQIALFSGVHLEYGIPPPPETEWPALLYITPRRPAI